MASTAGMVPITRSYLAKYYDKYPYTSVKSDFTETEATLRRQIKRLDEERLKTGGDENLLKKLEVTPAHKLDENLWMNREQVEEILELFKEANWPAALKAKDTPEKQRVAETLKRLDKNLKDLLKAVLAFQSANSDRVYNMVLTYMPQDFRCSLIKQQRVRSEKKRQAQVEALVNAGGTIREKYALMWTQQMERRKQLADLGSASGVYKQLVKLLVGVPTVLLDFVKQINDHRGPMEEQRERYGPPLYNIVTLCNTIRIYTVIWWHTFNNPEPSTLESLALLERSVDDYVTEFTHFINVMGEVFEHSPFLIKAEEAGIPNTKADEFIEASIGAGKTHEVSVHVESEGSIVAWDFRLTSGKDVGFSVFFTEGGAKLPILPYQRKEVHQGDFSTPQVGRYTLVWDNSYSNFSRKTVRYKVDVVPAVLAQLDPSTEDTEAV